MFTLSVSSVSEDILCKTISQTSESIKTLEGLEILQIKGLQIKLNWRQALHSKDLTENISLDKTIGTKFSLKGFLIKETNENKYIKNVFTKQSFYCYCHRKNQPFLQAYYC